MNDLAAPDGWLEANQRYLCAEFARVRALLEAGAGSALVREADAAAAAAHAALPWDSALERVTTAFGLSEFERTLLLLCAGVEMDASLREWWRGRPDAPTRPTFGVALATLPLAHWSATAPDAPLRRWRLVNPREGAALLDRALDVDERVLHALAGIDSLDARLAPFVRGVTGAAHAHADDGAAVREIAAALTSDADAPHPIVLVGGDPDRANGVARRGADAAGWTLLKLDARAFASAAPEDRHVVSALLARERRLGAVALLADARPTLADATDLVDLLPRPLLFCAPRDLAAQLPGRHIRLEAMPGGAVSPSHPALEALADRVVPAVTWDDVVLPEAVRATLHDIAEQVRQRARVHEQWGFARRGARGLGVTALFSGESGTGKTMAAEALSGELGLPLYRVDLSGVVSKYIGETEKNLRRVFDAAEDGGAILLFDEADALFGKRSEVRDSHDRYANIEVSYLLQRMEDYAGLALLTTNARTALDRAFQRRLRFVVEFPFPDASHRERIWRAVFPPDTPTQDLDFAALARPALAGGTIRNIAINAAFRAAGAGRAVTMADLAHATRVDAAKRERPSAALDTRGWT
jgi:AAA+ superfamily predicted ATPase